MNVRSVNLSDNEPVFLIAELSANHCHQFELAEKTVRAAKEAGADAIKLQTYTADTITIKCNNEHFQIKGGTLWDGKTLHELYGEAYTPWEWHAPLKDLAQELGLVFFSSPFDKTAVDFLEELNVPAYKIASFEIEDIALIEYAASKKKPMIISTGIASQENIEDAIEACRRVGNKDIALLKCTSAYPAQFDEINLRTLVDLKNRFNVIVGLSDHTPGISVPVASVALGAKIIEKHFILDRSLGGPDAEFSLEPDEFSAMAKSVREVEAALGNVTYELSDRVEQNRQFGRSLFFVEDVTSQDTITEKNVRSIRPGIGLSPKFLNDVLGKKVKQDTKRGTPLSWDLVE